MKKSVLLLMLILFAIAVISCTGGLDKALIQVNTSAEEMQELGNKLDIKLEQKFSESSGERSNIFSINNTNGADSGFEKLITLMESQKLSFYKTSSKPEGLIAKDDVVLLKFNCQWNQRGGTNTDLIKSVAAAITKHPEGFQGEVIIADNGQAQYGPYREGGSVEWTENNAIEKSQSVKKVAEEFAKLYKVSAMTWDSITTTEVKEYSEGSYEDGFIIGSEEASTGIIVSYPKFMTHYGTYISFKNGIWNKEKNKYDADKLKIINMPVLKSHINYYVTASIKNYMGTTSDKLTGHKAHNSILAGGMGTQMSATRSPILNIIDAIWINPCPYKGPYNHYDTAAETDIIACSTDPVALDYWSVKNILIPAAKASGYKNYQSMDPDGEEPGTFGAWLRKSMIELEKAGLKVNIEEEKINVYVSSEKAY